MAPGDAVENMIHRAVTGVLQVWAGRSQCQANMKGRFYTHLGRIVTMNKNANEGNPENRESGLLSMEHVEAVVDKINQKAIATVERGALDIGEILLEDVFQGSLDKATFRNPFKNVLMMLVCAHKGLEVNRRRLGEWVRAAALRKELIAKGVDCSNLSYSHFAALLLLDDDNKRRELAATANTEQWKARKLIAKVDKLKAPAVTKGKTQKSGQSSDEQANKLLEVIGNPLALMQDEETKKLLADPQDMRRKVTEATVLQLAHNIDHLIASMQDSAALLKLAKKNITMLTLERLQAEDAEIVDVQATVV
jgi:hypothetical protein